MTSVQIINHSDLDPSWHWLEPQVHGPQVTWRHHSTLQRSGLSRLPVAGALAARLVTANRAVSDALRQPSPLLVSHGPRPGYYAARVAQLRRQAHFQHLVFSFNFTSLPSNNKCKEMARAYRSVDRFTVFSSMERALYANCFDIDLARIDMLHWGVKPSDPATLPRPAIQGRYICAVGSQGRDYRVLLQAARLMPQVPLHLVVHPINLQGLDVPAHVTVHTSVPFDVAAGIVANAEMMVLPLLHNRVPCGHVTAVTAMHLGRAIVATDSVGLHDYLKQDQTADLVEPANPQAMAQAITRLWEDPASASALGQRAKVFAQQHCLEEHTVAYFKNYLKQRTG
jgi:glycosyltransferase involved in cell wall biosynthesis